LNIQQSRENPRNLCEDASQGKQREFAAAPGFDCAPTPNCKRPITARLPNGGRPLSRVIGGPVLGIFLVGAVFAFASPWSMNQAEVRVREFAATSVTPMIGGWWRFLVRPDRAGEKSAGSKGDKQLVSVPDAKTQPPQSQSAPQGSGLQANPAQDSHNPAAAPLIPNPAGPARPNTPLNEARPLNQIDQYLWSVYERSGTKRDSTGDFTWKDEAAAARLGLNINEYVISGMDPDFRELLYDLGHAMDAAGIDWTILSAFRDDYRQGLAAGFKAHRGFSFHGGSIATGGYGHGCAADLEAADGKNESNETMWKWLDQHGEQFGIRRPMRQIDPAHVQPVGAWHEAASELREKRADIRPAGLRSDTAGGNVERQVFPVSASEAGVSEAQFECVRHHRVEHLRTARLLGHPRLHVARVLMWERRHRHARWRMLADNARPGRHPGVEASPNSDELSRTAKRETAESRSSDKHPAAEPSLSSDEAHQTTKWRVADTRSLRKRPAAEALMDIDRRPHRSAKWRTFSEARGPQKRPGAEFRHTARSRPHLHFVGPSFGDAATGRS
jgi:hypothetical protein